MANETYETKMTAIPSQEAIEYDVAKLLVLRNAQISKLHSLESFKEGFHAGATYVLASQAEVQINKSEAFIIQHTDKLIGTIEYWQDDQFIGNIEHAAHYYSRELAETTANVIRQHHNGLALEIVHIQTTTSQIKATELPR